MSRTLTELNSVWLVWEILGKFALFFFVINDWRSCQVDQQRVLWCRTSARILSDWFLLIKSYQTAPAVLRVIFSLKGLQRTPGVSGTLSTFAKPSNLSLKLELMVAMFTGCRRRSMGCLRCLMLISGAESRRGLFRWGSRWAKLRPLVIECALTIFVVQCLNKWRLLGKCVYEYFHGLLSSFSLSACNV